MSNTPIDLKAVIDDLTEQIKSLTLNNTMLRVMVRQQQEESAAQAQTLTNRIAELEQSGISASADESE